MKKGQGGYLEEKGGEVRKLIMNKEFMGDLGKKKKVNQDFWKSRAIKFETGVHCHLASPLTITALRTQPHLARVALPEQVVLEQAWTDD